MHRFTQVIGLLVLVSLAAPLAVGCNPKAMSDPLQHNEAGSQDIPNDTLITLERTTCFGTCPSYKITIGATGAVIFEGRQFVKRLGKLKSTISQQRLRELLAKFEEIKFFDLKDHYRSFLDGCTSEVTDAPAAFTSIRIRAKSKTVEHYDGCGGLEVLAELEKLEQAIDDAVNSAQWIR